MDEERPKRMLADFQFSELWERREYLESLRKNYCLECGCLRHFCQCGGQPPQDGGRGG